MLMKRMLVKLAKNKSNSNKSTKKSTNSVLQKAIQTGDTKHVYRLVNDGIQPTLSDLNLACRKTNLDIVKLFVEGEYNYITLTNFNLVVPDISSIIAAGNTASTLESSNSRELNNILKIIEYLVDHNALKTEEDRSKAIEFLNSLLRINSDLLIRMRNSL